jgi:hypothetical protein
LGDPDAELVDVPWDPNGPLDSSDPWPLATECIAEYVIERSSPRTAIDPDNDHVCNYLDNCNADSNADQADNDQDGKGDACDPDDDNDGVTDVDELAANMDPLSSDSDGDSIPDGVEYGNPPDAPTHSDEDGVIDALDLDSDDDGLADSVESGPPLDSNENGRPDFQEDDRDLDGYLDGADNCPSAPNPSQTDNDGDGDGDECDEDDDIDGIADVEDTCRLTANPGQADTDGDSIGDACEPQIFVTEPAGDPTIVGNGSRFNEICYSTSTLGVLTIDVRAQLNWAEYDSRIDKVYFTLVGNGGAESNCAPAEAATQDGHSFTGQVVCTGLPAGITGFGLKLVTAEIVRNGNLVGEAEQGAKVEVFWPLVNNTDLPVLQRYLDANMAKNHPGLADSLPFGGQSRPPNWVYYYRQNSPNSNTDFVTHSRVTYLPNGAGNLAVASTNPGVAVGGITFYGDFLLYAIQSWVLDTDNDGNPEFSANTKGVLFYAYHVFAAHEWQHHEDHIRWTEEGRGIPVRYNELWPDDMWLYAPPLDFSPPQETQHFTDLDDSDTFSVGGCDFTGDLVSSAVDMVYESEIRSTCDRSPTNGMHVNFDGLLSSPPDLQSPLPQPQEGRLTWQVNERNAEDFDHDRDNLPNWEDLDYLASCADLNRPCPADAEESANQYAISLAYTLGPAHAAVLDWSCGGYNYDH